jgi:hypothetical protein
MDKEIEDTLEYFKKQCLGNMNIFKSQFGKDSLGYIFNNELLRNLNSIKQALLELKSIKEIDSTEALKQVTYLSAILPDWQRVNNGVDSLSIIKQALTTKSEKEQAFDIANKKCVNMFRLAVVNDVNSYNKWVEFDEYMLTEEEFDLLKKVLYAKNI